MNRNLILSAAIIFSIVCVDGFAYEHIKRAYERDAHGILAHCRLNSEAATIAGLVKDAGSAIAAYSVTKNKSFLDKFNSIREEIGKGVENLRAASKANHEQRMIVDSLEKAVAENLNVFSSIKSDVDNPQVTAEEMQAHSKRAQISTNYEALRQIIETLLENDLQNTVSESTVSSHALLFGLAALGLAVLNAILSGVLVWSAYGRKEGNNLSGN